MGRDEDSLGSDGDYSDDFDLDNYCPFKDNDEEEESLCLSQNNETDVTEKDNEDLCGLRVPNDYFKGP